MRHIFLFISSLIIVNSFAANKLSGEETMQKVAEQLQKIPAYTCNVSVKVDVEFIKIKDRSGQMRFTPPNRFNYNIKGFALLPKESPFQQFFDFKNNRFTIIDMDYETINNEKLRNIKLIPNDPDEQFILSQVWVDKTFKIRKMLVYTKDRGKVISTIDYANLPHPLPLKIAVTFDLKQSKLPAGMDGDISKMMNEKKVAKDSKGTIYMFYSNYKF